jgi:hypothetical protein
MFNWTSYNEIKDTFWKGSRVTWLLPKENTMLLPTSDSVNRNFKILDSIDESGLSDDEKSLIKKYGENYYIYTLVLNDEAYKNVDGDITDILNSSYKQFSYKINNTYNESLYNNTIRCIIELPPENYGKVEA